MSFVFASSHLPEASRPQEDDEEEKVQRSGMVRAFSHLPQRVQGEPAAPRPPAPSRLPSWASEPPHAGPGSDPDSHGDFEPPATARSDSNGSLGPSSPRRAAPPAGRSLFLTPRPMPPEHARQQATTYGAAPDNRANASSPGYGSNPPAATAPSTGNLTPQDVLDLDKLSKERVNKMLGNDSKTEAEANPTADPGNAAVSRPAGPTKIKGWTVMDPELYKANQEFEKRLEKQREMGKAADNERTPLEANSKNIKSLGGLRTALKATKAAQDLAKKMMPKKYRDTFNKINKETGLAPAEQIKKLDAKINASKARTSELKKNVVQPDEAYQQALNETQEAGQTKQKLEEKQKQLLEQQRKQQEQEQQQKQEQEQQENPPKYQPYG